MMDCPVSCPGVVLGAFVLGLAGKACMPCLMAGVKAPKYASRHPPCNLALTAACVWKAG